MRALLIGVVLLLFLSLGCTQSTPSGDVKEVVKEVTIETQKYVCWNNDIVDMPSECPPQPEKIIEKTNEVIVETTKYVCPTGIIKDSEEECKDTVSEAESLIDKKEIEKIVIGSSILHTVSYISFDNNVIKIEYMSSRPGDNYGQKSVVDKHYVFVKNLIEYISDIGLTPSFELIVIFDKGGMKLTNELSWDDALRIKNFEVTFDEWKNGLVISNN